MSLSVDRLSLSSEQYTRWCAEIPSLPLYVQPWWLLAASGCEEMSVLATRVAKEDAPMLVWPLFMPTQRHLIVPPCCQFTGPLSDRLGAVGEEPFDRDRYMAHLAAMEALGEALPSSLRYIEAVSYTHLSGSSSVRENLSIDRRNFLLAIEVMDVEQVSSLLCVCFRSAGLLATSPF